MARRQEEHQGQQANGLRFDEIVNEFVFEVGWRGESGSQFVGKLVSSEIGAGFR